MQQLRYEGARLDDVLARIRSDHGVDANIVSAELVRSGGVAGFFTKELYRVLVNPGAAAPASAPTPEPAPAPPRTDDPDRRFAELLAELIDEPTHADTVELSDRPGVTVPAAPASGLLPPVHPAANRRLATPPAVLRAQPRSTQPLSSEVEEIIDLIDGESPAGGPTDPIEITSLLRVVSERMLAPAPVIRTGILAIIGAKADAVRSAVALSESLGSTAADVLIAAPDGAANASAPDMADFVREHALQRAARGVTGPTIVVVIVTPGIGGHRWATELLAELAPLQTRLAVAGWRPFDRLEQTIAGLGGVDVVDLVDSGRAAEPERYLDLPVPVGMIDGRPATPTIWAATLASLGRVGHLGAPTSLDDATVTDPAESHS